MHEPYKLYAVSHFTYILPTFAYSSSIYIMPGITHSHEYSLNGMLRYANVTHIH